MKKHSKTNNRIALLVFSAGVILGLFFNTMAIWADFEASLFDSGLQADEKFPNLRCPVFIGKSEKGRLFAKITNPLDRTIAPKIRAHVSEGLVTLMREIDLQPTLAPGETQPLEWTVTSTDATWGRFILFRVYQFPVYPIPTRSSTCGVLVSGIPLPGQWLTALVVMISVAGIGAGIWLWIWNNSPLKDRKRDTVFAMAALGLVTLAGMIFVLFQMLIPGVLTMVLSVILVVVLFAFFAMN
jgi:hypothetical protein